MLPVYVDEALLASAAFTARMNSIETAERSSRILYASLLLRLMRRSILRALDPGQASNASEAQAVPLIMVLCNDLNGFTYKSAVYVNIAPVLWHTGTIKQLAESLFHTILHELAHRTIVEHDTLFADELARLVFRCSRCLDSDCFHSEQTAAQMTALCYELAPLHS